MGWLGTGEILIILFIALILFGPKKLPELGKIIGSGLREIRKYSNLALDGMEEETSPLPEKITESPDIVSKDFVESEYPGNLSDNPQTELSDKQESSDKIEPSDKQETESSDKKEKNDSKPEEA